MRPVIPAVLRTVLVMALWAAPGARASAQVQSTDRVLPLSLAVGAANEAVQSCAARGRPVTVTVVDAEGVVRAQLKGDRSTIHTRDSSFRKAYTQVTLGPVFGFERMSDAVARFNRNPSAAALATLPDMLVFAGAVAVRVDGETIAAIGVGGSPGGDKDEGCAAAGLSRIADRLGALAPLQAGRP